MYLDRHHVELLAGWSILPTGERGPLTDDVAKWLSVVFDGATREARDFFVASFNGSTEGWPWTAIDAVPLGYTVKGFTIDHAPRALVLLLGAWVLDPDLVSPENVLSDESWEALAPRLSSWDPNALLPLITDDGWLDPPPQVVEPPEQPGNSPDDAPPPENEPETKPDAVSPAPPTTVAVPWYRRTSFLVGAGVAATAVTVVVLVRARR